MTPFVIRCAPRLSLLLLCGSLLAGCAGDPSTSEKLGLTPKAVEAAEAAKAPTDLDSGVRQAQLFRLAGRYDDAVHVLSQLMLVAADDPRVVSEYGKTLAQQGRAQDALPFLTRAVELQPDNWSVFSAMGVAYDQLGDHNAARGAYERALVLRPAEPSVLNNYALSRMVANDPAGAQALMEKARIAGGGDNAQIARNMQMIASMMPKTDAPAPQALAYSVKHAAPTSAPVAVAAAQPKPFVTLPQQAPVSQGAPRPLDSQGAPRPLMPQVSQAQPVMQQQPVQPRLVVMQRVPVDPLAGPYTAPRKMAAKATKPKPQAVAAAPAKADVKPEARPAPVKAAAVIAPPLPPLPSDKAPAKVAAANPAPAKPAPAKAQPVKTAENGPHADLAIKAADVKPASKNQVPQLRLAAGIY